MINFIESFEWGGIGLGLILVVVLLVLFFVIIMRKRNESESAIHYALKSESVVIVVFGKYVVERKRVYSIIMKICDGISKTTFALGLAGATKLVWDYSEFSRSSMQGIIVLVLDIIALIFSVLADGFEEKTK